MAGPQSDPRCGELTTLDQAVASVDFALLSADTELGDRSSIDEVEVCENGAVVIRYASGVAVYQERSTLADPEAEWNQLAADHEEFSVGTVRGHPASLATPGVLGAAGGVDFVEDGIRITVTGDGEIPLDDLIAFGESLSPVRLA
jgi:hypothetical protein